MKSEIQIKDILYEILKRTSVASAVSGSVYKDQRPLNSELEDVVVSILASENNQVQTFIANVNVYIKDIKRGDEFIENTKRLRDVASLCLSSLDGGCENGYCYSLASQRILKVNGIDFHCINNRLQLKIHK